MCAYVLLPRALRRRYQLSYAVGAPMQLPDLGPRVAAVQALLHTLQGPVHGAQGGEQAGGSRGGQSEAVVGLVARGAAVLQPTPGASPGAWCGLRLLPGAGLEARGEGLKQRLAHELLDAPPHAMRWLRGHPMRVRPPGGRRGYASGTGTGRVPHVGMSKIVSLCKRVQTLVCGTTFLTSRPGRGPGQESVLQQWPDGRTWRSLQMHLCHLYLCALPWVRRTCTARPRPPLHHGLQDRIFRCITDTSVSAKQALDMQHQVPSSAAASCPLTEEQLACLLALRGLLGCSVLPHALQKRHLVDYGVDRCVVDSGRTALAAC